MIDSEITGGPGGEPASQDEEHPGGLFRSWPRLYTALVVYGILSILLLWILTRVMNTGPVAP